MEEKYGRLDYDKAEQYLLQAAEQEYYSALSALKTMYSEEKYGRVDEAKAEELDKLMKRLRTLRNIQNIMNRKEE